MRIESIRVDGFGSLRDRSFHLAAPLVLIYGSNEAGKSTLMGFIRAVLFGFPARTNLPERYEPVYGGIHGGVVTLSGGEAGKIRVERYDRGGPAAGRGRSSAGSVTVTLQDGTTGGEELLRRLLGGITPELFRNLFAFGLGELQEIRTLQSEELSGHLYSAGLGAGGGAILAAQRWLRQEMDALFKPRGKNQPINTALHSMDRLESVIRKGKENVGLFNQWTADLTRMDRQIDAAETELRGLRQTLNWYEQCMQARERWLRMSEIERQLAGLPEFAQFPEDAVPRYEALAAEKERLVTEMRRLEMKIEPLRQQIRDTVIDPELIDKLPELETVCGQAELYLQWKKEIADLRIDIRHCEQQLQKWLRQIDADWTCETLQSFPVSVAFRERVRAFRDALSAHRSAAERLRGDAEIAARHEAEAERVLHRLQAEAHAARRELEMGAPWLNAAGADELQSLFYELEREYRSCERLAADIRHLRQRRRDIAGQAEYMRRAEAERMAQERQWHGLREEMEREAARRSLAVLRRLAWVIGGAAAVIPAWLWLQHQAAAGAASLAALSGMLLYLLLQSKRASGRSGRRRRGRLEMLRGETGEGSGSGTGGGNGGGTGGGAGSGTGSSNGGGTVGGTNGGTVGGTDAVLQETLEKLDREIGRLEKQTAESQSKLNRLWHQLLGEREAAAAIHSYPAAVSAWEEGGDSPVISDEALDELRRAVERKAEADRQLKRLEERVSDQRLRLQTAQEQREHAEKLLAEQTEALSALAGQWDEWLEQHRLRRGLSPEAVKEIVQLAEQGKQLLQQMEQFDARRISLESQAEQFERQARQLLNEPSGHDAVWRVKQLKEEADKQAKLLEELRGKEALLNEWTEEKRLLADKLGRVERQIAALWNQAGAGDEEQFRRRSAEHALRVRLLDEWRHAESFLKTWFGSRFEELLRVLRENDHAGLNETTERLRRSIAALEEDLNRWKDERGRLRSELEKLKLGAEHAERLQRFEEHAAELQQRMRRYATLAFCAELFKKATEVYERERQPGVLRQASEYLSLMTAGRYRRITAPIGERRILVERAGGELVDTAYLSRGTAEQLYLAMRFALAHEYAKKTPLPLIMDDIFVNFDADRLKQTLNVLNRVAERHQIVLFTCHPHVRQSFADILPDHRLIELEPPN